MKISTWNCCLGIKNKKDIISDMLKVKKIDILCIQESEVFENEFDFCSIKNYNLLIVKQVCLLSFPFSF